MTVLDAICIMFLVLMGIVAILGIIVTTYWALKFLWLILKTLLETPEIDTK